MTIGDHIRQIRRERAMTQEQVAERLCITPQAVSRWETGQTIPDAESIIAMAHLFHCSADALLGIASEDHRVSIRAILHAAHEAARPHPGDADGREVLRILREGLRTFPGDVSLSMELARKLEYYAYYYRNAQEEATCQSMLEEARQLFLYCAKEASYDAVRGDACRELYSLLAYGLGRREEARVYLDYFPELGQCREMMEFAVNTPAETELIEGLAYYLRFYEIARLFPKPPKEQMGILHRIEALDALYAPTPVPGDYLAHRILYAAALDVEQTLLYLTKEAELARLYDDPSTPEYQSEMHHTPPQYRQDLRQEMTHPRYDFLRANPAFSALLADLGG